VGLWILKHDSEQLKGLVCILVNVDEVVVLWKRAGRALVLFRLCVTDTTENLGHDVSRLV
jgi:hypothetical protein